MRIEWSESAERQLREIFDYYSFEASATIAKRIVNSIIEKVSVLRKNPLACAKEELLSDYPQDYRCLVEGNYKIIYWIKENVITIASVFDCRQNPVKIKKI